MSPLPEQSRSALGYGDSPSNTSLRASIDAANMELLLPRRIEFVRASAQVTAKSLSGLDKKDDAPQRPNKWVFPEGGLEQYHGWRTSKSYGAGLRNQGNTCYLNSTLQCLSYVSTFAQASEAKIHERTCPRKRAGVWCGLCNLSNLVCRIHQSHGGHLSPTEVLRHLNLYFARFRPGRQEDAHDALRQLIDTCIRSEALPAKISPSAQNKKAPFVHPSVSQTTMLGQMFGYHTAQRIQCANCGHVSCTFHFDMDISLSISRCRTIDECLTRYFAPEIFKEQNAYKCAKCKRNVTAKKSTRLYDAPMNLTLSLKRYCYGRFGGRRQKDGHYVKYEKELDLSKFIADHGASTPGVSNKYTLSGVLVHSGATPQLGHYYAFVRNPAGFWYCCDDESVTPAKEHTVLSQQAYILFYERKRSKKDSKSQRHLSVESEPTVSTTSTEQNKAKKAVPAPLQQHQSLFYNSLTTPPDTPSTTAGELDNHAVSSGSVSSSVTTLTGDEEVHKEAAPTDRKRKHAVEDVESPQKKAHVDAKGETLPPAAAGLQQAVFVRMHPPKFGDEEKSNDNSDPDEEEDLPSEPVANQEEDPVVGQATKLAEVVRVESCGTAATIKPKERASLARSVRSQYGANKVSSWDSDDDEEKEEGREEVERARKEAIIQAQRQLQPKIAMRDSHDREYDKGKNRHKVRQHVEAKDNDFAAAYKRAKARLHGPRNKQQLMRDKRLHNRCQRRKGKPTITKSSS